jgi:hypothetical protein
MKHEQTNDREQKGESSKRHDADWVSRGTPFEEEIEQDARRYLSELHDSKKSNRVIVGWRPV